MQTIRLFVKPTPREFPFAILMSVQFFCIIAAFWIMKPLKKTLFIEHYDNLGLNLAGYSLNAAQTELLAKNINMVVALFAMGLFILIATRFRKNLLLVVLSFICIICLATVGVWLTEGNTSAIWAFYTFGDLFNMLMVTGFFAFLNDSVSAEQAKRLFGFIVFGGVAGGALGSTMFKAFAVTCPVPVALSITGILVICVAVCAMLTGKHALSMAGDTETVSGTLPFHPMPRKKAGTGVFKELRQSRYLLSIASVVVLYEVTSTLIDYQFTSTVERYLNGPEIGEYFAGVYMVVNVASLVIQLFCTSALMKNIGVSKTIAALPITLLLGSILFIFAPVLLVASFLCVGDNSLNYTLNQSSKESLYTVLSSKTKYNFKAFVDIFLQRSSKAIGVNLTLALSLLLSVKWITVFSISLIITWLGAAVGAGRFFERNCPEERWDEKEGNNRIGEQKGRALPTALLETSIKPR